MEPGSLTGTSLGPYRVESMIGRGGMGEVYRAHDTTLGRQVALKVIHGEIDTRERLARFVQEARSASALNHPNVVSIHQIGRETPARDGMPAAEGEVTFIARAVIDLAYSGRGGNANARDVTVRSGRGVA